MEKHHKFSIWYVLIAIWVVLIVHDVMVNMFAIEHIPYSDFIKALEQGKVSEIAITADRIQGKIKTTQDGKQVEKMFTTVRVDQNLSQLLEKYNVTFKGVSEDNFVKNLASWVIPILIFLASGTL